MNLSHELSTILYNIEKQNAELAMFIAKNKDALIEREVYDTLNSGYDNLESGAAIIGELF